jgi:RNA polymerase sigma-70 factor (ECF subfamily)
MMDQGSFEEPSSTISLRENAKRLLEDALCGKFASTLRRQCRHLASNRDVENDLGDVWMRAWVRIDQFRGSTREQFVGWLQKIVRTTAIDAYRRHRRQATTERAVARVEAMVNDSAAAGLVEELLAGLSECEVSILYMHEVDGLTFRKIAEELRLSEACVRQKHSRSWRKIKTRIDKNL